MRTPPKDRCQGGRKVTKLEIEQLGKSFDGTRAVDGVDLSVAAGETLVLLGASGCGKTTLLRLIAGFLRPDTGVIRISGKTVASPSVMVPPERRSLSMVFQSYAVWPHKSVFENIAYGLRLHRFDRRQVDEKVAEALALVRMEDYARRYPGELSGGQQQRVALARALALSPEILLFDEPLSNLDAMLREHMRFETKALLSRLGITAVYVTHDQQEAMVVGDRIAVMNKGRVEQLGTAEEIYYGSRTSFVARFVGMANVFDAELLGDAGAGHVRLRVPGLGEIVAAAPAGELRGRRINAFVRPESIRLGPDRAHPNRFSGRVARRTFLGSAVDLLVEIGGTAVRVLAPCEDAAARLDEETVLSFSPDRCLVLAAS
jgi:ABC-type Fe3+/spermidine/putrescine transport system ATPase subunit